MTIQHMLTDRSLTFYVGSTPYQVDRSVSTFDQIRDEINKGDNADTARLIELANTSKVVERALKVAISEGRVTQYLPKGTLSVTRNGVTFDGEPMEGPIADRLMDVLSAGFNIAPWVRFVENLLMNPAEHAREELLLWLETADLPITNDGHFLAYKRVRSDYTDIHSGSFDNSVGQLVQLEGGRQAVDPVRDRTCSYGLHFCSKEYLPHFSAEGNQDKVVVVKINPADVVSIPSDYDNTKGRTWRYEVVDEIPLSEIPAKVWAPVYDYDVDDDYDYDDYEEDDDDYDDYEEPEETDEDSVYHEAFAKFSGQSIVALRGLASRAGLDSRLAWKVYSKSQLVNFLVQNEMTAAGY